MANLSSGLIASIVALLSVVKLTDQLRFEAIQIPGLVQRGANFWLSCQFQLDLEDQLYSVKWYKNNEEFYRLLSNQAALGNDSSWQEQQQQQQPNAAGQQQYFSQNGVNVLMSSSNATHVRLLNASLESEGFYACEISTQNLSSIRYEREIRVYVLPHSRLSVIGFKNRYSMGDQLDLACATDYSRPRAAIAWFINNQLIQQDSQSHFTLELQNKSKLNEPTLFKQTLSLKFKLTTELMHWLSASSAAAAAASVGSGELATAGNRRNQGNQSLLGAGYHQQLRPNAMLRLQCKYKLTEVSDLTFNELLVHQKSTATLRPVASRRRTTTAAIMTTDSVSVSRLPDQRLAQSKCPAKRVQLQSGLFSRRPLGDECRLGQLALQPDDPLMVEAAELTTDADSSSSTLSEVPAPEDESGDGARRRRQVIGEGLSVGDVIAVNCSTISALLEDLAADRSSAICSDAEARRRSIISGKYQHGSGSDPLELPASNQRWTKLNLNGGWTRGSSSSSNQQQQLQNGGAKLVTSQLILSQRQLNEMLTVMPATDTTVNKPESTLFSGSGSGSGNQLEAPPLLEWFINNQEVSLGGQSTEGDTEPIDYVSYFANFDSKPVEQQLPLRLNLTKKHFMTPDSVLRMRCSSTQAQVLMADSVTLTIAPVLIQSDTTGQAGQQVWQQKQASKQIHRKLLKPSNLGSRQPLELSDSNSGGIQLSPQTHHLPTILFCILLSSVRYLAVIIYQ